ncbi:MAG: amidohydrolase family protein, partial [Dehalococcoidales bacterium]
MIIDFHTHVFPPQVKQKRSQYIDRDPCFALLYAKKEAKVATAEELIDSMDRAGIDVSVIANFGWMTHDLCAETNDYILESIARFPKRLIGFCTVQPQSLDAAIAEIERCAENGARGIGELRPDIQLLDLEDEAIISPLMETIKKHRLILLTHASEPAGHDYPGKGIITPDVLYPFIIR